ncbi:MAG TPA: hypothetical protein VK213_07190 [Bacteroidales bacterium]|nr:hypothetical protein [Bacteroidales bacterium]
MKKSDKKAKKNMEHRGNTRDVARLYQLEMNVVHKIPPVYYEEDGEVKESEQGGIKIK